MCVCVVLHQIVGAICIFLAEFAHTSQDDKWIEKPFSVEKFKVYQNLTSSKQQAVDICRSHGAALPEPRTRGEISFLAQLTNHSRTFSPRWLWLGMTRTSAHIWAWDSDGAEVDWSSWQHVPVLEQPKDDDNCSMFVPPAAPFGYVIFLAYFHCAELGGVVCRKKEEFAWISKPYSGEKFKLFMKWKNTYESAMSVCEKHGAFLPEPRKYEDIVFLGKLINTTKNWIWLGMTKNSSDDWIWNSDGSKVSWLPFERIPGSRPSRPDANCTILFPPADDYLKKMFWTHSSCQQSGGVVCQKDDEWILRPCIGKSYRLFPNSVFSYEDAKSICQSHGGLLPEPKQIEEVLFIGNLIKESSTFSESFFWIGITNSHGNTWVWNSDGTNVSWSAERIPPRGEDDRDENTCIIFRYYNEKYGFHPCDAIAGVVCQKNALGTPGDCPSTRPTNPGETTSPEDSGAVDGVCYARSKTSKTSKYAPLEVIFFVGLIIICLILYKYGTEYRKSLSSNTTSTDNAETQTQTDTKDRIRQRFLNVVSKALKIRIEDSSTKRSASTSKSAGLWKRLRGFWSSGADKGTDLDLAQSYTVHPVLGSKESNVDTGVVEEYTPGDLVPYEDQTSVWTVTTTSDMYPTTDSTPWTTSESSELPPIRHTTRTGTPEYKLITPTKRTGTPEYRQIAPTRRISNHLQVPLQKLTKKKKKKPVDQGTTSSSTEKKKPQRVFLPWLRQH